MLDTQRAKRDNYKTLSYRKLHFMHISSIALCALHCLCKTNEGLKAFLLLYCTQLIMIMIRDNYIQTQTAHSSESMNQ